MSTMAATLTMTQYLAEIEYSARNILEITWRDHDEAHRLAHEVNALTKATRAGYQRAGALAMNAEDADDVAMAAGAHWDTYFGIDKERHAAKGDYDELAGRLQARNFSTASAAGAVLQHAKQGVSIVHGGPASCPEGRMVTTSQSLKNLIWQGRNQAIHWEEGSLSQKVVDCFDALANEHYRGFADVYVRSLAFDVLRLLGWRNWEAFHDDLLSLG